MILPDLKPSARVGLIGGSFDPPHKGHQQLAESFLAQEALDQLWIIPCGSHAIKNTVSDFSHRLNMCELSFADFKHVRVLDLEDKLPKPSYTIQTIKAIKASRPDLTLSFALGSDLAPNFPSWHQASELSSMVQWVIFMRENYPLKLPDLLKRSRIHDKFIFPDTNSTNLRKLLCQSQLEPSVFNYINKHALYKT